MSNFISDITEEEKNSRAYGDQQQLEAGDKEKVESYERSGNQSKEYYER